MKVGILAGAAMLLIGAPLCAQQDLSDAQIAHIAYTAGQLDLEAGEDALPRLQDPDVRAFAETMIRDHRAVNDLALALVNRLGVTPEGNATSESLTAEARKTADRLRTLQGADFDRAYIANEAAFHKTVNGALSSLLIPSAENPELKALLERGLRVFEAHQVHAEELARATP